MSLWALPRGAPARRGDARVFGENAGTMAQRVGQAKSPVERGGGARGARRAGGARGGHPEADPYARHRSGEIRGRCHEIDVRQVICRKASRDREFFTALDRRMTVELYPKRRAIGQLGPGR